MIISLEGARCVWLLERGQSLGLEKWLRALVDDRKVRIASSGEDEPDWGPVIKGVVGEEAEHLGVCDSLVFDADYAFVVKGMVGWF